MDERCAVGVTSLIQATELSLQLRSAVPSFRLSLFCLLLTTTVALGSRFPHPALATEAGLPLVTRRA